MANSRLNRWLKLELKGYERPADFDILKWVETRRHLSSRSEERGPMRLNRTPYVRPWLRAAVDPDIEEVVICASAQVAKTEFGLCVAGFYADVKRSTVLVSLADEQTARHISRDRIRKMFEDSPDLRPLLDGAPVVNNEELSLSNGAYIGIAWASSVAGLATRSFRVTIADEIDKPGYSVKSAEAMPLSLIRERTESYYDFKHIFFSTPTVETGNITEELEGCDVVYDWHVPCPICGVYQPLRFTPDHAYGFNKGKFVSEAGGLVDLGGVIWEGGLDATDAQVENGRYRCGPCGALWTTPEKNRAVIRGKKVSRLPFDGRARKVGFHVNRLYSLLGKSGDIEKLIRAFITAKRSPNPRVLQGFINSTLAEPYVPKIRPRSVEVLRLLKDDRPKGLVPNQEPVACLLAGVDTQDDGFFYEIRAFGYGLGRTSWGVREGKVGTFEDLAQVLWSDQYYDIDGNPFVVSFTLQDAMGHRASEVYDFCRLHRGYILPTQGVQRLAAPVGLTNLSFYPGTKKPIPGGMQLVRLDTNFFKSRLANQLEIVGGDPGAWNYHSETPDAWFEQMTAEVLNDENLWENPRSRPNHAWDVSVLCQAAHEYRGVGMWAKPEPVDHPRPPDDGGSRASSWISGGRSVSVGAQGRWLNRG